MNGIQIDRMKREDLPQIRELYRDLIPGGCDLEKMKMTFAETAGREEYCLLAARQGERVLGSATGIRCDVLDVSFLVVENVVVRKDCRGQGVGRRMFRALDEFARESRCEYAILISSGFRKTAHRFYEAMGYVDDVRGFRKIY